jgi:hypothetical protein
MMQITVVTNPPMKCQLTEGACSCVGECSGPGEVVYVLLG